MKSWSGLYQFLLKLLICFWRFKNNSFTCINSEFWSKILALIFRYFYIGWEFEGKYIFSGSGWLCAEQRCMVDIKIRKHNSSKLAFLLLFKNVSVEVKKQVHFPSLLLLGLVIYSALPGDVILLSFQNRSNSKRLKPAPIHIKTLLLVLKDKFCFWASLPYKLSGKSCISLLNFPLNTWVSVLLGVFFTLTLHVLKGSVPVLNISILLQLLEVLCSVSSFRWETFWM